MKNQKKGFTIVELVIVIAVIAILASVLVPTFSGIVLKAQRSADTQVVRMLNEDVAIDLASIGKAKHDTMHQAVQACIKQGLSPDKISAKSDYKIAWESTSGNFVLIDLSVNKVMYPQNSNSYTEYDITGKEIDYFIVSTYDNRVEEDPGFKYSIYAYGKDWPSEIKVHAGFDTGDVTSIKKITYSNESSNVQNVLIATNNFDIKIYVDGSNGTYFDTINHYGYAWLVSVNGDGKNLYYEYGVAGRIALTNGTVTMASNDAVCYCAMKLDSNASFNTERGYISPNQINIKAVDSSITPSKDDQAVANTLIADCGYGNHEKNEVVYDGNHVYYVCPCCGYILVNTNTRDANTNIIYHGNVDITNNNDDSIVYSTNVYTDTFKDSVNLEGNRVHDKAYQSINLGKHLVYCKDCSSQYEEEHTFDENGKCIYCDYVISLLNSKWTIKRIDTSDSNIYLLPYSLKIDVYFNEESCAAFLKKIGSHDVFNKEFYVNRHGVIDSSSNSISYINNKNKLWQLCIPDGAPTLINYNSVNSNFKMQAYERIDEDGVRPHSIIVDYFCIEIVELYTATDLSKYECPFDDLTVYKALLVCGELIY